MYTFCGEQVFLRENCVVLFKTNINKTLKFRHMIIYSPPIIVSILQLESNINLQHVSIEFRNFCNNIINIEKSKYFKTLFLISLSKSIVCGVIFYRLCHRQQLNDNINIHIHTATDIFLTNFDSITSSISSPNICSNLSTRFGLLSLIFLYNICLETFLFILSTDNLQYSNM